MGDLRQSSRCMGQWRARSGKRRDCGCSKALARLAQFGKTGWKPKRTLKFVLWDAEEFGLVGSTEWVEKHEAELKNKAVVYFNSDTNGKGEFSAADRHRCTSSCGRLFATS